VTQLSLLDSVPPRRDRAFVCDFAVARSHSFRPEFPEWLQKNFHLWGRFESEANKIWGTGRRHYSSRTLWEVMRHHTMLTERDSDFKINNNFAPDVARLYLLIYPERDGFFELRESPTRRAAA
jgi:hypothetical protein